MNFSKKFILEFGARETTNQFGMALLKMVSITNEVRTNHLPIDALQGTVNWVVYPFYIYHAGRYKKTHLALCCCGD